MLDLNRWGKKNEGGEREVGNGLTFLVWIPDMSDVLIVDVG